MNRVIQKSSFVVLLLLGLANLADYIYASSTTNAATSNISMQATILPSMTVEVDNKNPILNITPSSTGTFDSTSVNVAAYSNGSIGYNLTMTPSDTDLTGISTGSIIPTLASGSYTSTTFPAGYWGVSVDSGNYVPAAVTSLATVNSANQNVSSNTHTVNLAANLDLSTAADSYSTTLTFAATATIQAYPITFNFNNNITSLAIKDANNVTKATITTSGGSANLDFASTYTIVPTYANNAGLSVIRLNSGEGYLNNTNSTYTVGSGSATIEFAPIAYMQDFTTLTSSEKTIVLNNMVLNQQYQLKDNRDQKDYYVAKLADGNVWMTQNLDHDIVTTTDFYTYDNTDIGHGATPNTNATWTAQAATYTTNTSTWETVADSPESYDPGNLCWDGTFAPDFSGVLEDYTETCGSDKHYHIGNYYNWTAAVAMNDSSSYTTNLADVDQSICPAGWRLPKYSGDKSYDNLVINLDPTSGVYGDIQIAPAYFVYGGTWMTWPGNVGAGGYYWTSAVKDDYSAVVFTFTIFGGIEPQFQYGRHLGNSVRCVAR